VPFLTVCRSRTSQLDKWLATFEMIQHHPMFKVVGSEFIHESRSHTDPIRERAGELRLQHTSGVERRFHYC
jgi:hypothetical protein